ncbi:MAG: MlaD family protein [Verrucomicrobia bacterium]|jgi:ABC-type transporter Mla subunit MlaD|nr:MlaD family protein [Verrucomicrobiota bacterium]
MALQDLTPQLRTRLNRVEKAVGWFVLLAVLLLCFGFGYYAYNTAKRKGWFIQKIPYQTSLSNATGLRAGDPVMLMGFTVGEITRIEANGPWDPYGVTVYFRVKAPYFGYVWSDSTVKVAAADFLGNRVLEITKGAYGVPTVLETTNKVVTGILKRDRVSAELAALLARGMSVPETCGALNQLAAQDPSAFYTNPEQAAPYWLDPAESPAITERLDKLVTQVESALPNFLAFTNQLGRVLSNSASVTANLDQLSSNMIPASADLAHITAQLRDPGSLGEWAMGTNFPVQIGSALTGAERLVSNTDSNLLSLTLQIGESLENVAALTSNLNWQVQLNTNMLGSISDAVVHADELVQGLKRHWLLRSAFKEPKERDTPSGEVKVLRSPRDAENRR